MKHSHGHLKFKDDFEVFQCAGAFYCAPASSPVSPAGYRTDAQCIRDSHGASVPMKDRLYHYPITMEGEPHD